MLALLTGAAQAQYLNRAVYLGRDVEGIRRDHEQGVEYFLDRLSYVDLPPWWTPTLEPFRNNFTVTGGSVSSTDMTLENRFDIVLPMDDGVSVDFHALQSEDQEAQYLRTAGGLGYDVSETTRLFVQLEGGADKENADFSFGAELWRSEHGRLRAMATVVDFAGRKDASAVYDEKPYGLMLAGDLRRERVELYGELSVQLPFEQRDLVSGGTFAMDRTIARGELRWRLGPEDRLVLTGYGERCARELRPADPGSALREDYDSGLVRLSAEWWRDLDDGFALSGGLSWLRLDEDGVRPNNPAADVSDRRRELLVLMRTRIPLGERWRLEPNLWAGHIDRAYLVGGGEVPGESFDGFQGKLGLPLVYTLSADATISIMPTFQLDEAAFGGGSVQLVARF